jgi:hypothetical protein
MIGSHIGSILFGAVGDEGVALAGVVGVHHLAVLLKCLLDLGVGDGLVNPVDEELRQGGGMLPSGLTLQPSSA